MLRKAWLPAAVVALVLALPVANLLRDRTHDNTVGEPALAPRTAVMHTLDTHCMDCHDAKASSPFYASWPGARRVVASDVARGLQAFDLDTAFRNGPPDAAPEVILARLEHVLRQRDMPLGRYVALHWDASMSRETREELLDWITTVRRRYYAPPAVAPELQGNVLHPVRAIPDLDRAKVALGRRLFHDTRLSGDGQRSCASCHDLAGGGASHQVVSMMPDGQPSGVNVPTVFNAALQVRQGWRGHAADLREQSDHAVRSPIEMASSWEVVIPRLMHDKALVKAFRAAYPAGVTAAAVTDALAVFQRSLVTPGARFDRFLAGETSALDAGEKRGYHAFVDAGCATCHVGKALGGQSLERAGGRREVADPDRATPDERVKVPMLRNVASTAPYFHDGSVPTLRQAVATMGSTHVRTPLTDADADDVTAFLRTLTGNHDGRLVQ